MHVLDHLQNGISAMQRVETAIAPRQKWDLEAIQADVTVGIDELLQVPALVVPNTCEALKYISPWQKKPADTNTGLLLSAKHSMQIELAVMMQQRQPLLRPLSQGNRDAMSQAKDIPLSINQLSREKPDNQRTFGKQIIAIERATELFPKQEWQLGRPHTTWTFVGSKNVDGRERVASYLGAHIEGIRTKDEGLMWYTITALNAHPDAEGTDREILRYFLDVQKASHYPVGMILRTHQHLLRELLQSEGFVDDVTEKHDALSPGHFGEMVDGKMRYEDGWRMYRYADEKPVVQKEPLEQA